MITIQERITRKVPGITSLFIKFDYKPQIIEELKKLDCKDYDKKTQEWEVPLSEATKIIQQLCKLDDIDFKVNQVKDPKYKVFILNKHKTKPFDHQIEAIQYGLNHDKWLLLDTMGLGKSLSAIELAEELKLKNNLKHCLIICGINNLKANWRKEIKQHSNLTCKILGERKRKNGTPINGSIQDRIDDLKTKIDEFFIITNIETLRDDRIIKALEKSPNKIDMIITDEIHATKNPQSQQGKHFLKLTNAKYRLGMTGTLLLNNPLDAYIPLKWIGAERSNYTTFKYHYCQFGGKFHNILTGYKNLSLLKYQLNKYSLRRTKDILNLPAKNIINEYLDMNDMQAQFYENIKNGIIDEVDKVHMSTSSLLAIVARLRQATACPSILTSENIESTKITRACEIAEELIGNGNKVVIFSTFKQTVAELEKKLAKYKPIIATGDSKDEEISKGIDDFQTKKDCNIFIGTWQKCGTGITLTAASYMIFIDTPYTQGAFEQACDRIYRIGTKDPVFIYNLICNNTIDERVLAIVQMKKLMTDYIIDDIIPKEGYNQLKQYIEDLI